MVISAKQNKNVILICHWYNNWLNLSRTMQLKNELFFCTGNLLLKVLWICEAAQEVKAVDISVC